MVSVMRVDVAPLKHFIILIGVAVMVLVVAIIIGATGPNEFDSKVFYAYKCPDGSHNWSIACEENGGVELSNNFSWLQAEVPPVNALNRFWSLQFQAYTQQPGEVERALQLEVFVWGWSDPAADAPRNLLYVRNTTTETIVCDQECDPLILVDEQSLQYTYYAIRLRFMNGGQLEGDTAPFLGDVKFTIWTGHSGYSSLELALRIVFLFLDSGVLIVLLWHLRRMPMDDWAWEQRSLVLILLGIVAMNNPFYGLRYVARGWFFHFLDAMFNLLFLSIFLLFGLLVLDKIRLEEVRMELGKKHIPKFIVVGIFAIMGIVLFSWVDIRDSIDPIIGHPKVLSDVQILFYIEATVYAGILIWLAVLVVMTIPVATAKPYLLTRFLFASVPTSFCIIAILIGIFNGTFGPLNESTLSMVFFITLYNLYVWILTWGYWPIQERFGVRNPSEADAIIRFEDKL